MGGLKESMVTGFVVFGGSAGMRLCFNARAQGPRILHLYTHFFSLTYLPGYMKAGDRRAADEDRVARVSQL